MTRTDSEVERGYQIRTVWDFDPNGRGIPPDLSPEEALEFVAAHSGLPDETWQLVDAESGEVLHTHDV